MVGMEINWLIEISHSFLNWLPGYICLIKWYMIVWLIESFITYFILIDWFLDCYCDVQWQILNANALQVNDEYSLLPIKWHSGIQFSSSSWNPCILSNWFLGCATCSWCSKSWLSMNIKVFNTPLIFPFQKYSCIFVTRRHTNK